MKYKVLELYSGIGGMHCALSESDIPFEVVAAIDINTTANQIYEHNFPGTKLLNNCIESLSIAKLNKLKFNMLVMSPPCQPFCRVGKRQDTSDERTKSFLYILDVLPRLESPPEYILVENVRGFDTSESRQRLLHVLNALSYEVQEFLLSPLQFGIPNSRLRYYLTAKRKPLHFNFETTPNIITEIPVICEDFLMHQSTDTGNKSNQTRITNTKSHLKSNLAVDTPPDGEQSVSKCTDESYNPIGAATNQDSNSTSDSQSEGCLDDEDIVDHQSELPLYEKHKSICRCVGEYLQSASETSLEDYLLPEKFFRRFWVLDIVTAESRNCCCFTKRYAHHMEGSGSVIQMNTDQEVDLTYYKKQRVYDDTVHEAVRQRKLRYFSPREIANLMCFPRDFGFPSDLTNIQCYRVLGNSLNVHVVSVLIRLLVAGEEHQTTVVEDLL